MLSELCDLCGKRKTGMNMNNKGFTIAEIVIAASIGLIVLGAVYAAMNMGQRSSVAVERKVVAQQEARAALEIMALEIRMASYNPTFAPNSIWCDPATCNTPPVSQTYKGIQEASTTSITVEMDIDGSSSIKNVSNEVIRYNYDTANEYVTRETNCGGAQPFLGAQPGQPRDLRVVNSTVGIPLFRYYKGDGSLIPPANLPADIPDIRRIEITLVIDTEDIDPGLGQRRRMIYSTSVLSRNHAIAQ